jgi:hypothetical protein
MMAAFILHQIFIAFKACLPYMAYAFDFNPLAYVRWHLLTVAFFAFGMAFVHHTETTSVLKHGKSDVPQN